jgi:hypothetical protein
LFYRSKEEKKELREFKKEQKAMKHEEKTLLKEKKEYKKITKQEKKEHKKAQKNVNKRVAEILNVVDMEGSLSLIKTKSGYSNIFQIEPRDIESLNSDELNTHIYDFARVLKTYNADIKIIVMNFPVNTFVQQKYVVKKQREAENEVFKKLLDQKLVQLRNLQTMRSNKEYYLCTYSKDKKEEEENRHLLFRLCSRTFIVREISASKKRDILFKLNNQNAKIMPSN